MSGKNYSHQLDAKNRMRIPAKLREELGSGYTVTVGSGGCLYVYTAEQMKEVKATLTKINAYRESQLKAARFILYNSWEAEEDKQGRILLPENLRKYAKIVKNVVVFKGPNCVEIWSEEVWNDYFKDVNFGELADALDCLSNNG
ncbi:MAG TPA: cell division/cell wall cluster transcriptional repressor MraZ [Clostridiales bacterium]|nr:cell division/cell wall cluster transcriptional repressor MraZ [Clostridiales bacterium]